MVAFRIVLVLTAAALAPAALAQTSSSDEVVAAAPRAKLPTAAELPKKDDTPAPTASRLPTQEQLVASMAYTPRVERNAGSGGYTTTVSEDTGPRRVHGSAGVSVGTGGYRSGYIYSEFPVGETGTLGVAISQTDYGKNRVYGYGYGDGAYDDYYDAGYGYGYRSGYGGYSRGGRSQSLGVSLDMTGAHNRTSQSDDCAPAFRAGDRYVEPVWVTRMNGNRDCDAASSPEP